jgi:hypothetical protein
MVTPAMYNSMHNLIDNYGMRGFVSNASTDSGSFVPLEDDEKREIQNQFKKYGTKKGQYQLAFTSNDLKYVPISSPIKDMLLPEQQKLIKTIIADILGFDTAILNNDAANKYANYKEARKSLFTENIIPASNNVSESLSDYFDSELTMDFSHLDIFSEDEKTKSEKIAIETQYIINLNTSVSLGNMTKDSAVELLILNGYEKEIANKLIQDNKPNQDVLL